MLAFESEESSLRVLATDAKKERTATAERAQKETAALGLRPSFDLSLVALSRSRVPLLFRLFFDFENSLTLLNRIHKWSGVGSEDDTNLSRTVPRSLPFPFELPFRLRVEFLEVEFCFSD